MQGDILYEGRSVSLFKDAGWWWGLPCRVGSIHFLSLRTQGGWGGGGVKGWVGRPGSIKLSLRMQGG